MKAALAQIVCQEGDEYFVEKRNNLRMRGGVEVVIQILNLPLTCLSLSLCPPVDATFPLENLHPPDGTKV